MYELVGDVVFGLVVRVFDSAVCCCAGARLARECWLCWVASSCILVTSLRGPVPSHGHTAGLPLHRLVTTLPGLAVTLTFAAAPPAHRRPPRPAAPPPQHCHTLHTRKMETKHCVKPVGSAVDNIYLSRNHGPWTCAHYHSL